MSAKRVVRRLSRAVHPVLDAHVLKKDGLYFTSSMFLGNDWSPDRKRAYVFSDDTSRSAFGEPDPSPGLDSANVYAERHGATVVRLRQR